MIKAIELRLGNKILYKGKETTVAAWHLNQLNETPFDSKDFEPILLTDSILDSLDLLRIDLVKRGEEYYISSFRPLKVKYLHRLQNLYYELTNEELPIKVDVLLFFPDSN